MVSYKEVAWTVIKSMLMGYGAGSLTVDLIKWLYRADPIRWIT